MITGRVQMEESSTREIEVGRPFARRQAGEWKSLDGKTIPHKSIKLKEVKEKSNHKENTGTDVANNK